MSRSCPRNARMILVPMSDDDRSRGTVADAGRAAPRTTIKARTERALFIHPSKRRDDRQRYECSCVSLRPCERTSLGMRRCEASDSPALVPFAITARGTRKNGCSSRPRRRSKHEMGLPLPRRLLRFTKKTLNLPERLFNRRGRLVFVTSPEVLLPLRAVPDTTPSGSRYHSGRFSIPLRAVLDTTPSGS